jgi:hypothetical protein
MLLKRKFYEIFFSRLILCTTFFTRWFSHIIQLESLTPLMDQSDQIVRQTGRYSCLIGCKILQVWYLKLLRNINCHFYIKCLYIVNQIIESLFILLDLNIVYRLIRLSNLKPLLIWYLTRTESSIYTYSVKTWVWSDFSNFLLS